MDYKWKNLNLDGRVSFVVGHSFLYQTKSLNRFVWSDVRMYVYRKSDLTNGKVGQGEKRSEGEYTFQ